MDAAENPDPVAQAAVGEAAAVAADGVVVVEAAAVAAGTSARSSFAPRLILFWQRFFDNAL